MKSWKTKLFSQSGDLNTAASTSPIYHITSYVMKLLQLLSLGTAVLAVPAPCPMAHLHKRALPLSANENNSGPIDSTVFSASEQLVNVQAGSGHEFIAPTSTDKRGPCPGLNA